MMSKSEMRRLKIQKPSLIEVTCWQCGEPFWAEQPVRKHQPCPECSAQPPEPGAA